jgi:iron complex outermembrane receptor protein
MFAHKTRVMGGITVSIKQSLLLATATTPLLSFGAFAQDDETSGGRATTIFRDTITVTATKKANAEDVQDVPIAVSAFGADQLDKINFKDLSTVGALIPNTTLRETGTINGAVGFFIRGSGSLATIPSVDPTIGVFVDGVYYGNILGATFDNFDIESIEVLRGPQGILFGRNVVGGAVVVNTTRPTEEWSLRLSGQINSGLRGTSPEYQVYGVASGPLTDNLRAKAAFFYNRDDGWFTNLFDGEDYGKSETIIARGALEWDISESINTIVRYEHGDVDSQGNPFKSAVSALGSPGLGFDRDNYDFSINREGVQTARWDQIMWETNIDVAFGDGVITNIFGWRDLRGDTCIDVDATPNDIFNSSCLQDPIGSDPVAGPGLIQDQISNELRYAGTLGPVELTAGLYYFSQDINYTEQRSIFGGVVRRTGGGIIDHEVYSAFLNTDTSITDQLTLLAGVRYTYEEKAAEITFLESPKPGATIPGFCTVAFGDCPIDFADSNDWSNVDFRFGLQYQFSDNVMGYAQWSTGTRAGGYNVRANNANNPPGPFNEEKVRNYEVGFKTEPTDRILFNVTAFYQTSDDLQRSAFTTVTGVSGVSQLILNAADAEVYGIEADAQVSLLDNLLIIGAIGYNEGGYTEVREDFLPAANGGIDGVFTDEEALELPGLAPLTSSASIIHDLDLGALGDIATRVTYSHRGRAFGVNNDSVLPSTDLLDFNVSWVPENVDGLQVSVFGRNMTNDVVFLGDTQLDNLAAFGTSTFSNMAKGRHVGIELTLEL